MQLILTEEEYNTLRRKSGEVESQVKVRVEEEKEKILEAIRNLIKESFNIYSGKEPSCREVLENIVKILQ